MVPILGRFGPLLITSYQLLWGLGLVLGLWWSVRLGRRAGENPAPDARRRLDPLLAGGLVGLAVGRLVFVWLNWDYFQLQPHEAWQLRRGGLNYHAVLLAGLAGAYLWQRRQKAPWPRLAGTLALLLPFWHVVGWAACLLDGCAYGRTASAGFLVASLPDSYGIVSLRYASQALGLGLSAAVLLLAMSWRRRSMAATRQFWLSLALLAAVGAGVAWFRGDDAALVALSGSPWRLDLLVNAGLGLAAFLMALRASARE
jgi:prolipoprotein diacylglyceryltransferase